MSKIDVEHIDREHLPDYCGDRTVRLLRTGDQLCNSFEKIPKGAQGLDAQAKVAAINGHQHLRDLTV